MKMRFNGRLMCRILVIGMLVAGFLAAPVTDSHAMIVWRVYLALPTTPEPRWDWAETVVATTADRAVEFAYQGWQKQAVGKLPPLEKCRKMVKRMEGDKP